MWQPLLKCEYLISKGGGQYLDIAIFNSLWTDIQVSKHPQVAHADGENTGLFFSFLQKGFVLHNITVKWG